MYYQCIAFLLFYRIKQLLVPLPNHARGEDWAAYPEHYSCRWIANLMSLQRQYNHCAAKSPHSTQKEEKLWTSFLFMHYIIMNEPQCTFCEWTFLIRYPKSAVLYICRFLFRTNSKPLTRPVWFFIIYAVLCVFLPCQAMLSALRE